MQTKISSNPFQIHIFLLCSYVFKVETTITFIQPCSSLENHTLFQTKMGKVFTGFQTKKDQKPYPLERHDMADIREYTPPPPTWHYRWEKLMKESVRKLSNFNFQWTKTLCQNNLKNIALFFTFFKGCRCNYSCL